MKLKIPVIKLETFLGDANDVSNLKEIGHTSFQIDKSQINITISNNNDINVIVGITSLTMNDICLSHKCVFREIIPKQILQTQSLDNESSDMQKHFAYINFQRDNNKNSSLSIQVNNPKIIFALNTLFELKEFFFNPMNVSISNIQENILNNINDKNDNIETVSPLVNNNKCNEEDEYDFYNITTKDKMKLEISVNNPEIILLENHESKNTEAIVLSAKKIIILDNEITKFYVEEIGI